MFHRTKSHVTLVQRRVFHRTGALAIVFHRTLAREEALSARATQDRSFSNSVSQDTDTGGGTECSCDRPEPWCRRHLGGVCVRERLRGVALLKKAEGVDDIETEAQRPC